MSGTQLWLLCVIKVRFTCQSKSVQFSLLWSSLVYVYPLYNILQLTSLASGPISPRSRFLQQLSWAEEAQMSCTGGASPWSAGHSTSKDHPFSQLASSPCAKDDLTVCLVRRIGVSPANCRFRNGKVPVPHKSRWPMKELYVLQTSSGQGEVHVDRKAGNKQKTETPANNGERTLKKVVARMVVWANCLCLYLYVFDCICPFFLQGFQTFRITSLIRGSAVLLPS